MIINNIAKLRKDKNLTQRELANELNVSRQTIISLEDNKNNISLELAFKISNYFEKPIEKIFEEKTMNLFIKKIETIEGIKNIYGKNTIIIKNNIVFRCSTQVLEKGPIRLLNYELPKYGQMKKFVVLNNKVFELIPTREYENRTDIVLHKIGKQVDINPSCVNFNDTPWQDLKKSRH